MSEDFYPERGAGELQRFLQDKRAELTSLDVELQAAHDLAEDTEQAWTEHLDSVIEGLEEDLEQGRIKRLPYKDDTLSMARRTGEGRSIWNTYRRASRVVKKLEQRSTLIRGQVSAAQSEGKIAA